MTQPTPPPVSLSARRRLALGLAIARARVKEWCLFDCRPAQRLIAAVEWLKGKVQLARGRTLDGWATLLRLHRTALSPAADRRVERLVCHAATHPPERPQLQEVMDEYVAAVRPVGRVAPLFADPRKLFVSHATVLKSATAHEKGLLLLNYTYVYAPFAKLFDLRRIAERYYLALEPSWSGSCDENILAYGFLPTPVFVQVSEPRDADFLRRFPGGNLVPVPTAANWWVDHRLYRPLPGVPKDRDLVMVAAWGEFKRHHRFFDALRRLRNRGRRLSAILVGYPSGMHLRDIVELAEYYGVRDQVEFHEWLPPEEVNRMLNRARVNVVWSRREGSNRAVIEGLFAGLPCVMRAGFNYGHPHDYITPTTGRYADDRNLPDVLAELVDRPPSSAPRDWAMAHMTCEHATAVLENHVRREAARRGEPWSGPLAPHVSVLHGNQYLHEADAERFGPDYEFLATAIRVLT